MTWVPSEAQIDRSEALLIDLGHGGPTLRSDARELLGALNFIYAQGRRDALNEAADHIEGQQLPPVPTVPPEPPIGSVVYVDGEVWIHREADRKWFRWNTASVRRWSDIADRATPAVPLADVVQALVEWTNSCALDIGPPAERIERLFGWSE